MILPETRLIAPMEHTLSVTPGGAQAVGIGWLGTGLAVVMGLSYGGFLVAGALAPLALAKPAIGSIPWSFLLSAGLLVEAVLTTGIYVLLKNAAEDRT